MNKNIKLALLATIVTIMSAQGADMWCNDKVLTMRAGSYVQRFLEGLPYPSWKLETQLNFTDETVHTPNFNDDFTKLEEDIKSLRENPIVKSETSSKLFLDRFYEDYNKTAKEIKDPIKQHAGFMFLRAITKTIMDDLREIQETQRAFH